MLLRWTTEDDVGELPKYVTPGILRGTLWLSIADSLVGVLYYLNRSHPDLGTSVANCKAGEAYEESSTLSTGGLPHTIRIWL